MLQNRAEHGSSWALLRSENGENQGRDNWWQLATMATTFLCIGCMCVGCRVYSSVAFWRLKRKNGKKQNIKGYNINVTRII